MGLDDFSAALNSILVEAYRNILRLEEMTLRQENKINLSINEMHLIESVGEASPAGLSVSELAERLKVTRPSVTVAVKKLEKKGYVKKTDWESDGRVVRVCLTPEGRKIDAYHKYYHRNMVRQLALGFSEEERVVLLEAIRKLNEFFKNSIGESR